MEGQNSKVDTTGQAGPAPSRKAHTLPGLILRAERKLRMDMDRALRPYGITAPVWGVLLLLWRDGPRSSAELARRLYVTPQAVGQIIGDLEQRGLVVRRQDPIHGRRMLTQPTASGRELVEECAVHITALEERFLGGLNEREKNYFIELFTVCVDHLEDGSALDAADDRID